MKELEYKIICSALMSGLESRARIFRTVTPRHFENDETRSVFNAMAKRFSEAPNADAAAFVSTFDIEIQRKIIAAMNELTSPVIAEEQLPDTLKAFNDDYVKRTLKSRASELAFGEPTPEAVREFARAAEELTSDRTDPAREYLDSYFAPLEYIPTGFKELDALLGGGFIRGTLATIGARPSTGKTTFAINIAAHNPDKRVLFVSVEMSARMIYDRLISDQADLKYDDCVKHSVSYEIVRGVVELYKGLTIADSVSDIEKIAELIYLLRPELVIIDYIQIVTSKKGFENNRQRVDYISRTLKQTAKKTGAQIISLSQITRAGKDKPSMSDLKESGGLEQDSDYIILLYREYVNDKSNASIKPETTVVTLDKNKFGRTDDLDMDFNGSRQRFTEATDVITRPVRAEEAEEDNDLPF